VLNLSQHFILGQVKDKGHVTVEARAFGTTASPPPPSAAALGG